ncbi:hypothetical protein BV898_13469 [Hypsibius exemplaris]|uniref:Receptor ligand binding region domain-containing protein n=1 Tax=Hypsibius exemplaris TaxID=2072580 RepID=A0A1W0WAM0_HYPEX|nr:hypothetical protein BV898_13469 [Hypsibius exemplaris]
MSDYGCPTTAIDLYGIAGFLDAPILGCPSAGIASLALNPNNNRFPLLIKTSFGFADVVNFFSHFFTLHNYKHICLLKDDTSAYFNLLSKFIFIKLRSVNPVLFYNTYEYDLFGITAAKDSFRSALKTANGLTRGKSHTLYIPLPMVLILTLFLAVELFELEYWGTIRYNHGDINDAIAKDAFQSLMVMSLRRPIPSSDVERFEESVKHSARTLYNYTFRPLEKLDPTIVARQAWKVKYLFDSASSHTTLAVYAYLRSKKVRYIRKEDWTNSPGLDPMDFDSNGILKKPMFKKKPKARQVGKVKYIGKEDWTANSPGLDPMDFGSDWI